MINVENGGKFVINHPDVSAETRKKMIDELSFLVYASRPVFESVTIMNKTKHCTVRVVNADARNIIIVIENPDDEIFKLEESNVETPAIG